jgi:hypothetical protein
MVNIFVVLGREHIIRRAGWAIICTKGRIGKSLNLASKWSEREVNAENLTW